MNKDQFLTGAKFTYAGHFGPLRGAGIVNYFKLPGETAKQEGGGCLVAEDGSKFADMTGAPKDDHFFIWVFKHGNIRIMFSECKLV